MRFGHRRPCGIKSQPGLHEVGKDRVIGSGKLCGCRRSYMRGSSEYHRLWSFNRRQSNTDTRPCFCRPYPYSLSIYDRNVLCDHGRYDFWLVFAVFVPQDRHRSCDKFRPAGNNSQRCRQRSDISRTDIIANKLDDHRLIAIGVVFHANSSSNKAGS